MSKTYNTMQMRAKEPKAVHKIKYQSIIRGEKVVIEAETAEEATKIFNKLKSAKSGNE